MVGLEFGVEGLGRGLFRSWWDKIGAGDYSGDDWSEYRWQVTTREKRAIKYVKQHFERTFRASVARMVVAGIQKVSGDIGRQKCYSKYDVINRFYDDYKDKFIEVPEFRYSLYADTLESDRDSLRFAIPREMAGFAFEMSTDFNVRYNGLLRTLMVIGFGVYDDYRWQGSTRPDLVKYMPTQIKSVGLEEYVRFKESVLIYNSRLSSIVEMIFEKYGDMIKSDDNEFYDEFLVVYDKVKEE